MRPNDKCPCGSGKKWKKCCGAKYEVAPPPPPRKKLTQAEQLRAAQVLAGMVGLAGDFLPKPKK